MKNLKTNSKSKNRITVYLVIPFFIIIPLFTLVSFSNKENYKVFSAKRNVVNDKMIPPDSLFLNLQSAINIASANPGEANYVELSLQYYLNGMYNECIQSAEKALEYNAASIIAYNNICSAYNQLGMWDKAIAAGQKALAVIPDAQLASNNLQVSIDGKMKLDKDIKDAEALIKISPTEANYISLGFMYYQAGNYELSIGAYKKVIEINKNNIIAYNNICSAYNELGKWADASVYCNKALAIDSSFILSKNNLEVAKSHIKK